MIATSSNLEQLKALVFQEAPDLHPAWLSAERALRQDGNAGQASLPPLERQPVYAQWCRDLFAASTATGMPDGDLSDGFKRKEFIVSSTVDGFPIPVLQLELADNQRTEQGHEVPQPDVIVIYYHGGGLYVGEADSEELSCRRIVKSFSRRVRLYSIGYRLMPKYTASLCISDALDGFNALRSTHTTTIVIGSSSGGQLAATVAERAPEDTIHGLLLRCPATCDPSEKKRYIPEWLRPFHTSRDPSFATFLLDKSKSRPVTREEISDLPLEASMEKLEGYPRTWIQLCSNDNLYSDGLCLGMVLMAAGVEVRVDVWKGWPHTFWLRTPHLQESSDADQNMLRGLEWLLE